MAAFTIYTGFGRIPFFPLVPCSCGGVVRKMSWRLHLVFNVFFLLLSSLGIYTERKAKRQ
ncbi:MauE/DoxX family redox-associated membrane protein [Mucilaginibacter humi]|uniref:MauE/DoxX family redox-associated membrane protein n=1 Tax=Mucilaginibacter humi TaxID=2732510 RepID=UPI003743EE7B